MYQSTNIQIILQTAVRHHQAGHLREAEQIYRQILSIEPDNPDANHLLGVISHQAGKDGLAVQLISKAIEKDPAQAPYYCNLGLALSGLNRLDEAMVSHRKALSISPDFTEAHINLGNVLKARGRLDDAIKSYRNALAIRPDFAEAHNNLGTILYEQGALDEAALSYNKAIAARPDFAEAHNNLGNVFKARGRLEEAILCFKKAVTTKPGYGEAHNNLGDALRRLGRYPEAAQSFRKAAEIRPGFAEAHNNLGLALHAEGKLEAAVLSYRKAVSIKPDYAPAYYNLGMALNKQTRLAEACSSFQKALDINPDYAEACNGLGNALKDQGKIDQAVAAYRRSIALRPECSKTRSNLLVALNYDPNISQEELYQEHHSWELAHAGSSPQQKTLNDKRYRKDTRLKIGYVSPDFRSHSVAHFFLPLLSAHDRSTIEIFCYFSGAKRDAVSELIRSKADHWREIAWLSTDDTVKLITADGINILIDLAGHTAKNRLLVFAQKPAPVQVTWLGYPNTTGLSNIQYRFTDLIADPPGKADSLHSEELVRLENGFLCYCPDNEPPPVSSLPYKKNGYITFGSFNNLAKVTLQVVKLWSEILLAVPGSRLILKNRQLGDSSARMRYLELFSQNGTDPDRLDLFARLPDKRAHLDLYNRIDIGLDPFPYNGTTTTCEALWMGVPVITMAGPRHAARVGASILSHAGMKELITEDTGAYIAMAVGLSGDIGRLAQIRMSLRDRMRNSPLCDSKGFARSVENAFRNMWQRYLQGDRSRVSGYSFQESGSR